MAFSTQRGVSDGTLQLLMIEIEFFDKSEITAYFNNIPTTAFVWATDKSIRFNSPVPNGVEVLIRRTTDLSQPRHIFSQGAQFKESTLDEDFRQILHIAQEAIEGANVGDIYQTLNMHGNFIKNVANAVDPGDVMNLGQVQAWSGSALNQANIATTQATLATAARVAADAARDLARRWAADPVDSVVADGLYSARHYATKAAGYQDISFQAMVRSEAARDRSETAATTALAQVALATAQANIAVTQAAIAKTEADRAKTEADKLGNANLFMGTLSKVESLKPYWKAGGQFTERIGIKRSGVPETSYSDQVELIHGAAGRFALFDPVTGISRFYSDPSGDFTAYGASYAKQFYAKSGSIFVLAETVGQNAHLWLNGPDNTTRAVIYAGADKALNFRSGEGPGSFSLTASGDVFASRSVGAGGGSSFLAPNGDVYGPIYKDGRVGSQLAALDTPHRLTPVALSTGITVGNGTILTLTDDVFNYDSLAGTSYQGNPGRRVFLYGLRELAAEPVGTEGYVFYLGAGYILCKFNDTNTAQRRVVQFISFAAGPTGFTGLTGYKRVPYTP